MDLFRETARMCLFVIGFCSTEKGSYLPKTESSWLTWLNMFDLFLVLSWSPSKLVLFGSGLLTKSKLKLWRWALVLPYMFYFQRGLLSSWSASVFIAVFLVLCGRNMFSKSFVVLPLLRDCLRFPVAPFFIVLLMNLAWFSVNVFKFWLLRDSSLLCSILLIGMPWTVGLCLSISVIVSLSSQTSRHRFLIVSSYFIIVARLTLLLSW